MRRVQYPFDVSWNHEQQLFEVHVNGRLVGSHRGRMSADKIGWKAVGRARQPEAAVNRNKRDQ